MGGWILVMACAAMCSLPAAAQEDRVPLGEELTDESVTQGDLEAISRQLSNPVGSVWSLRVENNRRFSARQPRRRPRQVP